MNFALICVSFEKNYWFVGSRLLTFLVGSSEGSLFCYSLLWLFSICCVYFPEGIAAYSDNGNQKFKIKWLAFGGGWGVREITNQRNNVTEK